MTHKCIAGSRKIPVIYDSLMQRLSGAGTNMAGVYGHVIDVQQLHTHGRRGSTSDLT